MLTENRLGPVRSYVRNVVEAAVARQVTQTLARPPEHARTR